MSHKLLRDLWGELPEPLAIQRLGSPAAEENHFKRVAKKMAPKVGLEPTTDRLTADCSTIELLWNPKGAWNVRLGVGSVKH